MGLWDRHRIPQRGYRQLTASTATTRSPTTWCCRPARCTPAGSPTSPPTGATCRRSTTNTSAAPRSRLPRRPGGPTGAAAAAVRHGNPHRRLPGRQRLLRRAHRHPVPASSKTAYRTAFLPRPTARRHQAVSIVGLTSPNNAAFTRSLGCYDDVITYDEIAYVRLGQSVYVDFSGSATVREAVHGRLDDLLRYDCAVGATTGTPSARAPASPGPHLSCSSRRPRAPKRVADWGTDGFQQRLGAAWDAFMEPVTPGRIPGSRWFAERAPAIEKSVMPHCWTGKVPATEGPRALGVVTHSALGVNVHAYANTRRIYVWMHTRRGRLRAGRSGSARRNRRARVRRAGSWGEPDRCARTKRWCRNPTIRCGARRRWTVRSKVGVRPPRWGPTRTAIPLAMSKSVAAEAVCSPVRPRAAAAVRTQYDAGPAPGQAAHLGRRDVAARPYRGGSHDGISPGAGNGGQR